MTRQEMREFAAGQVEWYEDHNKWIMGQIKWINNQLKRTRKEDRAQKEFAHTHDGGKYAYLYEGNYQGEETRKLVNERRRYQRELKKNAASIEYYKSEVEKYTDIEDPEAVTDTDTEEEEEENTMFTNYIEAVTADAAQYIRDNYTAEELKEKLADREEFAEELNDDMWVADEVTGNGSDSYTFDRAQARAYALADIDTVKEALKEFGTPAETIAEKFLGDDWEYFDVTARCYVLGQAIDAALDIIEAETKAA